MHTIDRHIMQAVQVQDWSEGPKEVTIDKPAIKEGLTQVKVIAAGFHQLVKSRAANRHYSGEGLPHTLGVDGVGQDVSTGKNVYFMLPNEPTGSFAEYVNVTRFVDLPQGVDPYMAAALFNPTMSSWLALTTRVDFLNNGPVNSGWSCIIIGASTMSGKIAAEVARHMGATRVVGVARNESVLQKLVKDKFLDEYLVYDPSSSTAEFPASIAGADVALDYLGGPYADAFFAAVNKAPRKTPHTYVSIGAMAGPTCTIPASLLRSSNLTIRGSGFGTWAPAQLARETPRILGFIKELHISHDEITRVKFSDINNVMANAVKGRIVFSPN